ncbi:DNA polymerase IV [Thermocrispum sp.]|uniref:DNA polymerase IV n=1 Tax=Thermocrispum agreste TaxID=37925 RepID=A0A2W4LLI5_9PSEU|nr:DNA polymerase IV [Thermocrispum sp.]PZM98583.1 MAG: DNA polymerase IV [Thermocrispum agreste]
MGRNTDLPADRARFRVAAGTDPADWPDDTGCGVLHIDMDAFFAAVELRSRPELAGRPVIVAGSGARSVVLSANYPARKFGVRSAMPVAQARRLCPHAVYLPPSREAYREISRAVMALFHEFTPLVEQVSVDEAFLDVSGALRRLRTTPARIGAQIRARVAADHGITCSVGVAPVKFVAKLASGMAKPDGMVVVPAAEVVSFLRPLPVTALWGVGDKTARALERAGLHTVADVADAPVARLKKAVGSALGEHLHELAHGRDPRRVEVGSPDKSLGAEHTFDVDQDDVEVVVRELLRLAERVAAGMRAKGLKGRTVSIKLRFADFTTITRARTLPAPTDVAREIHAAASGLLRDNVPASAAVRLVGVRVEGLTESAVAEQLRLGDDGVRWRDVEVAADAARGKFGETAVRPASLLAPHGRSRARSPGGKAAGRPGDSGAGT